MIFHFILTRFNLPLWGKDKNGCDIDREAWLKERLELFETYTLPSIINQSCQDFTWILLCDENTPVEYRDRIKSYRDKCHQIELIQVEDGYAWDFARIFSDVVTSLLEERCAKDGDWCLTTYLDNDDALHVDYVARIQEQGKRCHWNTFYSFDYGVQYFTELNMATCVKYANNHFMTYVERCYVDGIESVDYRKDSLSCDTLESSNPLVPVKTCFGFGSHFLLEKNGIPVQHVNDREHPMWCEVVHQNNVDNDVKMTFDTCIIGNNKMLNEMFGIDITVDISNKLPFYRRAVKQTYRRLCEKIHPRQWH